jgi:hypothetical protein
MTEEDVKQAIIKIEDWCGVGPDGTSSTCPETGAVYDTLGWTTDGQFAGWELADTGWTETPDLAWAVWWAGFKNYCNERDGKLRWRRRPKLSGMPGRYAVHARAAIA